MTTGLQPYPEYKDSGLPWLNRIPARWEEKRAKFYFREVDERSTTGTEQLMSVSHKTGVTPRKANVTMFMAESNVGCKICRPGDLVINTMWAWMAAMGVSRQTGLVSPSYGVYRPRKALPFLPDYVDHLVRTQPYVSEYICRSTGIRPSRLRLYPDDFLDIPIVCPPHEEQEAIVRFIGHHDRLVRRFIRNRRRLIQVLNEQNQAIINRGVTRGLDLNVPLKPSGIGWLGQIPAHWNCLPHRAIFREIKEQGYVDEPMLSVTISQGVIWQSDLLAETSKKDSSNLDKSKYKLVTQGDIVYNKMRAWQGAVGVSPNRGIVSPAYIVVRLRNSNNPDYFHFLLRTPGFSTEAERWSYGITSDQWSLRPEHFKMIYSCVPPLEEQDEIVSYIISETSEIQSHINRAQREIDLIRKYRARLITDVVTGKVDVRHLAPSPEAVEVEVEPEDLDEGLDGEIPGEDEAELAQEETDADD
jgi:type I restriction enzyme, S subunit